MDSSPAELVTDLKCLLGEGSRKARGGRVGDEGGLKSRGTGGKKKASSRPSFWPDGQIIGAAGRSSLQRIPARNSFLFSARSRSGETLTLTVKQWIKSHIPPVISP